MSPMKLVRTLAAGGTLVALAASPAAAAVADTPTMTAVKHSAGTEAEAAPQPTSLTRRVTVELNIVEVISDGDAVGCGELEFRHQFEKHGVWSDALGPGFADPLQGCSGGSVVLHDQPFAKLTQVVEVTAQDPLLRYRVGAYESDGFWGGDWAYSTQVGWDAMSFPDGETSHGAVLVNAAAGIHLKVQFDVTFETL